MKKKHFDEHKSLLNYCTAAAEAVVAQKTLFNRLTIKQRTSFTYFFFCVINCKYSFHKTSAQKQWKKPIEECVRSA